MYVLCNIIVIEKWYSINCIKINKICVLNKINVLIIIVDFEFICCLLDYVNYYFVVKKI